MSKKLEALKIKAEKELQKEEKLKLENKMVEIATREEQAKQQERRRTQEENNQRERDEHDELVRSQRLHNAAVKQVVQIASNWMSGDKAKAYQNHRDEFLRKCQNDGIRSIALDQLAFK